MGMRQFDKFANLWFAQPYLAESTVSQRRLVYVRDIKPFLGRKALDEIESSDVLEVCERIKARGAPGTALHARDVISGVFACARSNGYQGKSPVDGITAQSIAKFVPRNGSLSPDEVGILCSVMEKTPVRLEYRLALKLILLTLVRRSELVQAKWPEVDFERGVWEIPPGRGKSIKTRYVYLSRQSLDILVELKAMAGASQYLLPSVLEPFVPMSPICLNHTTKAIFDEAQSRKLPLRRFSLYDLIRTGSTILRDVGFNPDWIELALARDANERRRRLFDRTAYAQQLQHMMQEWANMVDAWSRDTTHAPVLLPPSMQGVTTQATSSEADAGASGGQVLALALAWPAPPAASVHQATHRPHRGPTPHSEE